MQIWPKSPGTSVDYCWLFPMSYKVNEKGVYILLRGTTLHCSVADRSDPVRNVHTESTGIVLHNTKHCMRHTAIHRYSFKYLSLESGRITMQFAWSKFNDLRRTGWGRSLGGVSVGLTAADQARSVGKGGGGWGGADSYYIFLIVIIYSSSVHAKCLTWLYHIW